MLHNIIPLSQAPTTSTVLKPTLPLSTTIWQGTWNSTKHHVNILNGNFYMMIPNPLLGSSLVDYETTILMDYKGVFRHANRVKISTTIQDVAIDNKILNFAVHWSDSHNNIMSIQFSVAGIGVKSGEIQGLYTTDIPDDQGVVNLHVTTLQDFPTQ